MLDLIRTRSECCKIQHTLSSCTAATLKTPTKDMDVVILTVLANAERSSSGPAVSATRHGSDKKGVIRLAITEILAITSDSQGQLQFTDFH